MNVSATVKNDEVTKITGKVTQAKGELSSLARIISKSQANTAIMTSAMILMRMIQITSR